MTSLSTADLLPVLCAAAVGVCAIRFLVAGVGNVYKSTIAYFAVQIILLVAGTVVGVRSKAYVGIYTYGYPLTWALSCLVLWDLYSIIFAKYTGIRMWARWCVYAALVLAAAQTVASASVTREMLRQAGMLGHLEFIGHNLVFFLAVLAILLMAALSRYEMGIHPNVAVSGFCFGLLLLGDAGSGIADHIMSGSNVMVVNEVITFLNIGFFSMWALLLKREDRPARRVIRRIRSDAAKRLHELEILNEILLRPGRK